MELVVPGALIRKVPIRNVHDIAIAGQGVQDGVTQEHDGDRVATPSSKDGRQDIQGEREFFKEGIVSPLILVESGSAVWALHAIFAIHLKKRHETRDAHMMFPLETAGEHHGVLTQIHTDHAITKGDRCHIG
jgi:hypothetical protein